MQQNLLNPDKRPDRLWWVGAACCLLAAAVLRLGSIGLAPFNNDEGLLAILATQVAHLKRFQLLGVPTSFGFHNPPLLVYLLAPLFRITLNPRLAMGFLALGGVAACLLTGLTARALWGRRAGLLALAILAFSVFAIAHSRRLWGHDTIVFWSSLCFFCTVRGVQKGRWPWLAAAFAAAAAAQTCHLSGILLWAVPLMALLVFPLPSKWRAIPAAAGALLLLYLPWVVWEVQSGFGETRVMLDIAQGRGNATVHATPFSPWWVWIFALADGGQFNALDQTYDAWLKSAPLARTLLALGRVLSVQAPCVGAVRLFVRGGDRRWFCILLTGALLPPVFFWLLPTTSVAAYQLPAVVPLALLAAFGLGGAMRNSRKERLVVICLLAYTCLWGAWHTWQVRGVQKRALPGQILAAPLLYKEAAIDYMLQAGEGTDYAVMQNARPPESGLDYWLIFLHFSRSGQSRIPKSPEAGRVFLLREGWLILPDKIDAWLKPRPCETFGAVRVYVLEGESAETWRRITRLWSAQTPSDTPE